MDQIEKLAEMAVLRILGFVTLAIGVMMLGLSFDLRLAFEAGGVLTLLTGGALFLFGQAAPMRDVRKTDAWIMVKADLQHLPRERAQQLLSEILREVYLRYSKRALVLGALMMAFALLLRFLA
jgi:hypothetical protein